jgi:hypothetical protein
MVVPEEFKKLTGCFWSGSHLEAAGDVDWIQRALRLLNPTERKVVKRFLTALLERNPSVAELQTVWRAGLTGYGTHDQTIRSFFEKIRDLIKD